MKVYIIDPYEKYRRQGNEISIHWVGGNPWCIREVEMEWGLPKVQERIEYDVQPQYYHIYENYDDAVAYLTKMRELNGGI